MRRLTLLAYLRAAQAYMLISMPQGTSTILGAFQAIEALLLSVFPSTVTHKLLRKEKFGDIFFELKIEVICCDAKVGLDVKSPTTRQNNRGSMGLIKRWD